MQERIYKRVGMAENWLVLINRCVIQDTSPLYIRQPRIRLKKAHILTEYLVILDLANTDPLISSFYIQRSPAFFAMILVLALAGQPARAQGTDQALLRRHAQDKAPARHISPLDVKRGKWLQYMNPGFYLLRGSMFLYQGLLSEQISAECAYRPSCSGFSKQLIYEFGLIKGIALSADRLTRCNGKASVECPSMLYNNDLEKLIDEPQMYRWDYK